MNSPSVVPFKNLHSEGPFEADRFEHFGLERPFNMAARSLLIPKCPSEVDLSRLEYSTGPVLATTEVAPQIRMISVPSKCAPLVLKSETIEF